MAMRICEVMEWLSCFGSTEEVGIDDGGLALRIVGNKENYFEIGGLPEEDVE